MAYIIFSQVIPVSEATMNVRRGRGKAPYNLVWGGDIYPIGVNTFFVRPTKSGHGTSVLTHEYVPKPGADFSIDNGVSTCIYIFNMGTSMYSTCT